MVTEPKFSFVGGALCLDFINTVGARTPSGPLREKFKCTENVKTWGKRAGVLQAADRVTPSMFARAIALREALYRICKAVIDSHKPHEDDLAVLNRELAKARSRERLRYETRKLRIDFVKGSESLFAAVAKSAADLLTSEDAGRIRACPGDACGWMFVDTSRNGSRQWCDMRICGNRAKARKFRQRSRRKTYSRSREA